jgi:hypothetical protein
MLKIPPAVRCTLDPLLIVVPLMLMTYFLFDPAAFNAFTAPCFQGKIGMRDAGLIDLEALSVLEAEITVSH